MKNGDMGIQYWYFSLKDQLSGISNDYSKNNGGLYLLRQNHYEVAGGLSREIRQTISESGWYMNAGWTPGKNRSFRPRADLRYERYGNRENTNYNFAVNALGKLGTLGTNQFSASYNELGRDYYISPDGMREQRLNINRLLDNRIALSLPGHWGLGHRIRYRSDLEQLIYDQKLSGGKRNQNYFQMDNQLQISKGLGPLEFRTILGLVQEQNQYSSNREEITTPTDYSVLRKNIQYRLLLPLQNPDSLAISWQAALNQFTTPDTLNYDDRDELRYLLTLSLHRSISPQMNVGISAQMNTRHLMYLSSRRSAQNNINRIYSLECSQNLRLNSRLRFSGSQRIFANYYIYDYEKLFPISFTSMIFRGLRLYESVWIHLSSRFITGFSGEWRFEEDGLIDWDNFLQQKTVNRTYTRVAATLRYSTGPDTYLEIIPYSSYRKDTRYSGSDSQVILDPLRIGSSFGLHWRRFVQAQYSIEDLRSAGSHQQVLQQGRVVISYLF